jgi:hypothetical protein
MYALIADAGQTAHEEPIDRMIADMRRRLDDEPALLAALEGDA